MTSIPHHPRRLPSLASLRQGSRPGAPWGASGLLLGVLAVAAGCPSPDPEGKYELFNEQTKDDREIPEPKMDFGAPVLPDLGSGETETGGGLLVIDGVYLVAVETVAAPGLPLQFLGEVTAEVDATGNGPITVVFQPLSLAQGSATEPREEVGDAITIESEVAEFGFDLPFGELMVTGAANPITGAEILADLELVAQIRSEDAWCGTVVGEVLSPIAINLAGSTFSATRLADRSERPQFFPCKCDAIGVEPGATAAPGCILVP